MKHCGWRGQCLRWWTYEWFQRWQ